MKLHKLINLIAVFVTLIFSVSVFADNSTNTKLEKVDVEEFFDELVPQQLLENNIAGATIAVTQGDKILMVKGFGFADIEQSIPVDGRRSVFRIASVSKLFIWSSVMQLVEKGQLSLDEDVNTYLDFTIPDTFQKPITLWNLMTHTPGFEDKNIGIAVRGYDQLVTLERFLKDNMPKRVNEPGKQAAYSNYGAALAGYIVQRVSGVPFEQYVEENIFQPLGMMDSTYRQPLPKRLANRMVKGYEFKEGEYIEGTFEYMNDFPAGSVSTTAGDMAKFSIANINGASGLDTPILTSETMREMQKPQYSNHPLAVPMGLGFEGKRFNNKSFFGHGGDINHFKSRILFYPEEGVGIFMAFNASDVGAVRHNIFQKFTETFFSEAGEEAYAVNALSNLTDNVEGDYVSNRRSHTTIEKLFWSVAAGITVREKSNGFIEADIFGSTHQFQRVKKGIYEGVSGPSEFGALIFEKADEDSAVNNLYLSQLGSMYFEQARFVESVSVHARVLIFSLISFLLLPVVILWLSRGSAINKTLVKKIGFLTLAIGGLLLVFTIVAAMNINEELMFGVSLLLKVVLLAPVLCMFMLVAVAGLFIGAYKNGQLSIGSGLVILLFIAVTMLYLWLLSVWNFLGWNL